MKKIYLLGFALFAFVFAGTAQTINDDFESYSLGDIGSQNPTVWSVWSGSINGAEDLDIQDSFSLSGTQGGAVLGTGTQDVLLLLGNQTSGTYTVQFQMYIPAGKSGYFNLQGMTESGGAGDGGNGVFNSPNLVFNNVQSANDSGAGVGGAFLNVDSDNAEYLWTYPEDTWFPVKVFFDVDGGEWTMTVNGVDIPTQPFDETPSVVGGIDFFSFDPNNEYYIDDVVFVEGQLGTNDFSADVFSVYPNPVKDKLNIESAAAVNSVAVYDVLGKQVLSVQPDAISPSVDMSGLSSGAYLVKVTIGNASKTVKVIK